MAVVAIPQSLGLNIKVQTGLSDAGKPVYKTRSYSNVKTAAADADVFAVGQGIGSLQAYSVAEIEKTVKSSLQDQ